ncbi:hypothetical protein SAMN04487995_0095 [Dyadobacter koreensis]|uniref:Uncharacterized protein n=1 Tax=Dyadobacter koreensis TaxID=408657 RepID=A0A1H6Q067_9BACT|nr:DUF6157 family protein [Dyadobacter koreensis]SEI37271.1 hypothetical protein SAMN04487995_0095 [Dyadobacter koreensis]
MKQHTTNYQNTFIEIAEDSTANKGEIPPVKEDKKTVANIQFDMVSKHPYKFTSDDVLFHVYAERKDLTESELEEARKDFFSKGQACLRASPLTKRYGWGIHHDKDGKIAMYAFGTREYEKFVNSKEIKVVKAMKSAK